MANAATQNNERKSLVVSLINAESGRDLILIFAIVMDEFRSDAISCIKRAP